MALKKDKQKVLGEVFTLERVKTFLNVEPPEGVNADFHALERAYRGMKAENFAQFVECFKEAGHDIHAKNPQGHSLADLCATHANSQDYLAILK